jgi:hypothetical protein
MKPGVLFIGKVQRIKLGFSISGPVQRQEKVLVIGRDYFRLIMEEAYW